MHLPYTPAIPVIPPRGTQILLALIAVTTVTALLVPTAVLLDWMTIDPGTLPGLRLSALWLNHLIARPGSGFMMILLLALGAWLNQHRLKRLFHQKPAQLIIGAAVGIGIAVWVNELMHGLLFGLALAAVTVGWGAASAERIWGQKKLLQFTAILLTVVGLVDALVAWVWPGSFIGLLASSPRGTPGVAFGIDGTVVMELHRVYGSFASKGTEALFHGYMAVFAAIVGHRRLEPLPIEGRHLIWLFVALDVIDLLFSGFRGGLAGLVAIVTARALMDGTWRPNVWVDRFHMWRLGRRRAKIRVVKDGERNWRDRTLH